MWRRSLYSPFYATRKTDQTPSPATARQEGQARSGIYFVLDSKSPGRQWCAFFQKHLNEGLFRLPGARAPSSLETSFPLSRVETSRERGLRGLNVRAGSWEYGFWVSLPCIVGFRLICSFNNAFSHKKRFECADIRASKRSTQPTTTTAIR